MDFIARERIKRLQNRVETLEKKVGLRPLESTCDRLNRGVKQRALIIKAEKQGIERRSKK